MPRTRVGGGHASLSLGIEVLRERGRQNAIEWKREVARSDFVVANEDAFEDGLVEVASALTVRLEVEGMT